MKQKHVFIQQHYHTYSANSFHKHPEAQ